MTSARICIVSSGSLSSGPRVEKEADALTSAGYSVHVLVCHTLPLMAEWDARLAARKPWGFSVVTWPPRARGAFAKAAGMAIRMGTRALHEAAARATHRLGALPIVLDLASSERLFPLLFRARSLRADLFIAHNLGALPVAAALALRSGALLAFDAEDDHVGQNLDPRAIALADALQARYLPRCTHVTAPSDGIASLLAERYGITKPTVVHNAFPWALRQALDGETRERTSPSISLYWYSQTLGLDRGLADLIGAAGLLRGDFQVHLRGNATPDVCDALRDLARAHGIADRLHLHPQTHPDELLSRTAEHDIGFALEPPTTRNRLQTVANKLFFYMLAGLAVVATETPGQKRVMQTVPRAGFTYPPGDVQALALGLQAWFDDPDALREARAAALEAARTQWSWERESVQLVARVRESLASSS